MNKYVSDWMCAIQVVHFRSGAVVESVTIRLSTGAQKLNCPNYVVFSRGDAMLSTISNGI